MAFYGDDKHDIRSGWGDVTYPVRNVFPVLLGDPEMLGRARTMNLLTSRRWANQTYFDKERNHAEYAKTNSSISRRSRDG